MDLQPQSPALVERILTLLAGALVLKVAIGVVSNYQSYFPPDFASDFLRGREPYFFGAYRWAFYTHILSGPMSLIVGLIQIGERFRMRFPKGHRWLGRVQVASVLFLVTPSGLAMAWHAQAGPIAGIGLGTLAMATAACAWIGAWSAMKQRFVDHRRWMWRCYLLLSSAVLLRLIGGLATVTGLTAPWVDPLANWMSWMTPLVAFEIYERMLRRSRATGRGSPRSQATREHGALSVS